MPEGPPIRIRSPPTHGVLATAVGRSTVLIVTLTVVEAEHPAEFVTVRVYVPAAASVTPVITGFCSVEVNPFGPVQAYEAIPSGPPIRFRSPPVNGELAVAVGTGSGLTIMLRETGAPVQLLVLDSVSVTVRLNVPVVVQLIRMAFEPCPWVIVPPPESTQL
jgi:hypothetical protein